MSPPGLCGPMSHPPAAFPADQILTCTKNIQTSVKKWLWNLIDWLISLIAFTGLSLKRKYGWQGCKNFYIHQIHKLNWMSTKNSWPAICFLRMSISFFRLLISTSLLALRGPSPVGCCSACTVWVDSATGQERDSYYIICYAEVSNWTMVECM